MKIDNSGKCLSDIYKTKDIKMLKRDIIYVFFLLFISNSSYAMFEEFWKDTTPNGKHIHYYEDFSNGIEYEGDSVKIIYVSKWYFYKGYTIGINQKDSLGNLYFASDELKNKVYQFREERFWRDFLSKNDLIPPIFTRWHQSSWAMFPVEDDGFGTIATFMILFIVVAMLCTILVFSLIGNAILYFLNRAETPFSYSTKVLSVTWKIIWKSSLYLWIPLYLVFYLLGEFPQSF